MKLVMLTRHAEPAGHGYETDGSAGPKLSRAGKEQAQRLAHLLEHAGITDIFTSETRRTMETAAPLAKALGLTPQVVPYGQTRTLAARIEACAGDVVLVVGHMDSVPDTIATLGHPKASIGSGEFDNLFIYAPATKTLTRLRY